MDAAHPETLDLYTIEHYTIEHTDGTWIWKPANYTINPENGTWKITSTFQSEHLQPLVEDLLLTFVPTFHHQVVVSNQTFDVYTITNSTISNFKFSQSDKMISFNVTGPSGTIGFCNVTIPKNLMWGEFTVLVNGESPIELILSSNATHNSFYFTFEFQHSKVQIIATEVAPEFPIWTSMLLILIVLTVAIAIYKRRLLRKQLSSFRVGKTILP